MKFKVDEGASDDESLFVDIVDEIGNRATVIINIGDEGITVDIFPIHVVDGPTASTYATYGELDSWEKD